MKNSNYLIDCIENPNHDDISLLWKDITDNKIVCVDTDDYLFYKFNTENLLYEKIRLNEFSEIVKNDLKTYLKEISKINTDKRLTSLIKQIGNKGFYDNVSKVSAMKIYDKKFMSKLDSSKHTICFKNGTVNLKTGEFQKRTEKDYFARCLDYDYIEDNKDKELSLKNEQLRQKKIKNIFKKVCNDSDEETEFTLRFLSYCLTGETREQKSLWSIGHSASNGKSTKSKIFKSCFEPYCFKMDRETLELGYSKVHKQMSETQGCRYVYIEELNQRKINTALYKDLVDGDIKNNEVLFGTVQMITIMFKLDIITNFTPNFQTDNGMMRRGVLLNHHNRFVDEDEYQKGIDGLYLKDKYLLDKFNEDKYKLSFFKLLLPYAIEYYKKGLVIPKSLTENFKELCKENDKMKDFIDFYFVKTNDDKDRIYKDEFKDMYNNHYKIKTDWINILSDLKRCNISYDRQKRAEYLGLSQRGVIIGLKLRNDNEELNPFDI